MVEFPAALNRFAFGIVVGKAHGGAVLADRQVDPVFMPAPVLDVEDGGIGLTLQPKLDLQPLPEIGALVLGGKRLVGMRIEMEMVDRLPRAAMRPQGFKFAQLGAKVAVGDEAARWPKADFFVVFGVQQVPDQGGTARASGGTADGHYASSSRSQCSVSTTWV